MRERPFRITGALAGLLAAPVLAGCTGLAESRSSGEDAAELAGAGPSTVPSTAASPSASDRPSTTATTPAPSSGSPSGTEKRREPRRSYLTIPELDLARLPVVRYRGSPDDGPGTRIQNRGPTASPRGPEGGVGPGEVGNFIVTGHRLSGAAPFRYLPSLRAGDRVRIRSGDTVFVYEITDTRRTSFRSPRSLAEQSAAVPGQPGREPTQAMITLSTCATIEDHAAGNFWSDRFGNPEHRIDKIGVLVATRPA